MLRAALVTGGARRIGRRIVEQLAADGYAVAIHSRAIDSDAQETADKIVNAGGIAVPVVADLFVREDLETLIDAACAAVGSLSLLVNNASLFEPDSVTELDADVWEQHFSVNLRAPVFLTQDFARQVPPNERGAVVNILDQRVWRLNPRFFSYTLSKAALWTATQTMAQALAPQVRVNAVGPGPTLPSQRQSPVDFAAQAASLPLRRGPDPDAIAEAVLYLAKAGTVTGQMIAVDGGQHLAWETPDVTGITE